MDWDEILAGATEAIAEAGFAATLEKRTAAVSGWDAVTSTATMHPIRAVQDFERVRDASGTLIGQSAHRLLVSADGEAPAKGDRIALAVVVAPEAATWHEVIEVRPVAPGGVPVLYEVDLAF